MKSQQHPIQEFPLTSAPASTLSPKNSTKQQKVDNNIKYCKAPKSQTAENTTKSIKSSNFSQDQESIRKSSGSTNDGDPFPKALFNKKLNDTLIPKSRNTKQYNSPKVSSGMPKRRNLELAAFVCGVLALIVSSNVGTLLIHSSDDLGQSARDPLIQNTSSIHLSKVSNMAVPDTTTVTEDIQEPNVKVYLSQNTYLSI